MEHSRWTKAGIPACNEPPDTELGETSREPHSYRTAGKQLKPPQCKTIQNSSQARVQQRTRKGCFAKPTGSLKMVWWVLKNERELPPDPKNRAQVLKQKLVHPCSEQHKSQSPQGGNTHVHWLTKGQTNPIHPHCGVFLSYKKGIITIVLFLNLRGLWRWWYEVA